MSIKDALRNRIIEVIAVAAANEIDGREITKRFDGTLDNAVGQKTSENLQRGPLTKFLLQLLEGLYDEDKISLIRRAEEWTQELRKQTTNEED